jgi:hypothetical protein
VRAELTVFREKRCHHKKVQKCEAEPPEEVKSKRDETKRGEAGEKDTGPQQSLFMGI